MFSKPQTQSRVKASQPKKSSVDYEKVAEKKGYNKGRNARRGQRKNFEVEPEDLRNARSYINLCLDHSIQTDQEFFDKCVRLVTNYSEAHAYNAGARCKEISDDKKSVKNQRAYVKQQKERASAQKQQQQHQQQPKQEKKKDQKVKKIEMVQSDVKAVRVKPLPKGSVFTKENPFPGGVFEFQEGVEYSPSVHDGKPHPSNFIKTIASDVGRQLSFAGMFSQHYTYVVPSSDDVNSHVSCIIKDLKDEQICNDGLHACLLCGRRIVFDRFRSHHCTFALSVRGYDWIHDAEHTKATGQLWKRYGAGMDVNVSTAMQYYRMIYRSVPWFKCSNCNDVIPYNLMFVHYKKCVDPHSYEDVHIVHCGKGAVMHSYVNHINDLFTQLGYGSKIIYDGAPAKQIAHNGMSLFPYSFIATRNNSGYSTFVPGLNPNEMHKLGMPPTVYSWVQDQELLDQWTTCIANRIGKGEPDYASAHAWLDQRLSLNPGCPMLLAFDFTPKFMSRYDSDKDYTYMPKFIYDIMQDPHYDVVGSFDGKSYTIDPSDHTHGAVHEIRFNGRRIGYAMILSVTPLNILIQYDGNRRVYIDTYTTDFKEKLAVQNHEEVGDFIFFYPKVFQDEVSHFPVQPILTLQGLDKEYDVFPSTCRFTDDIDGIVYHCDGTANTMCYFAALDKAMGDLPGYDRAQLIRDVHAGLATVAADLHTHLLYNANGNNVVVSTNQPLRNNGVDITPDLPEALDWGVYVHLLDYLSQLPQYGNITFRLYLDTINTSHIHHVDYRDQAAGRYTFGPGRHNKIALLAVRDGRTVGTPHERGHVYAALPTGRIDTNPYGLYLLSQTEMSTIISGFAKNADGHQGQAMGFFMHDPYTLDVVERFPKNSMRFKYMLDAHVNFLKIPESVALSMHWKKGSWVARYLVSVDKIFPQRYFQSDYNLDAVDVPFLRALLYKDDPYITVENVRIDRKWYSDCIMGNVKSLRQHDVDENLQGRIRNIFYNIFSSSKKTTRFLSTEKEDTAFVGLPVSEHVKDQFNKMLLGKRPPQAFYRKLIEQFKDDNPDYAPGIVLSTLMFLSAEPAGDYLKLDTSVCGVCNCVNIPRDMKQVANVGINPQKLGSYGAYDHDSEFEIIFPPPSYLLFKAFFIYYNNACQAVKDTACFCRTILGRPTQEVDLNFVYESFLHFYASFIPYVEAATYLSHKNLCEVHPRGKLYEDKIEDLDKLFHQICSGFVKVEPYPMKDDGEGGKSAPPRGIINPGPEATAFGLTFTHLVEHYMKAHPDFSKGKNFQEVAKDLLDHWSMYDNPVCIGCDFTQFENGVSVAVLIASMSIYVYLTGMPVDYVRSWIHRIVYFAASWLLVFEGKRISGEYQTSIGNMLIVGAIMFAVCEKVGNKCSFYSAGDDCLVFCEQEDLEVAKRAILEAVGRFGMLIKVEDIYYEFDKIHFCQQYPVETDKGWVMLNSIDRVLDKLAVQHDIVTKTKRSLNRLGCLGCYLEFLYGSLGFMRPLIDRLLSYKPYKEYTYTRAFKPSRDYHILEALKLSNNFKTHFEILKPDRMLEVMGFPHYLCDYYYKYFQNWTPFDYVDHRVYAEYLVEDGRIIFQIGNFALYNIVPKFHDTDLDSYRKVEEDISLNAVTAQWFDKLVYCARSE